MKFFLALLGMGYLALEFWFNASLLNTLGAGSVDAGTIHALEFVGKVISGVGLWLTLMKLFSLTPLYKRWGPGRVALAMPVLLIISVAAMSAFQTGITEYLGDTATPEQRKAAYAISFVKGDLVQGDIKIVGFDFTPEQYRTAEGKTFVALFPAFAISHPSADALFSKAAQVSVKNLAGEAQAATLNDAWRGYAGVRNAIVRQYNEQYLPASTEFMEKGGGDPEAMWHQYLLAMDKHRINIDEQHSDRKRMRVIEQLRSEGIALPDDWQLNDKDTFVSQLGEAKHFSTILQQRTGMSLNVEAGLPWSAFAAHPDVVRLFNAELRKVAQGKANLKEQLPLDLSFAQFEKRYTKDVDAAVVKRSDQVVKILKSPAATFAEGQPNAAVGREAVMGLKAPVLALGISCLFAIINFIMLVTSLLPGWIGKSLGVLAMVAALVVPVTVTNTITSAPVFHDVAARAGPQGGPALTWITNAQPFVYPLANVAAEAVPFRSIEGQVQPYL